MKATVATPNAKATAGQSVFSARSAPQPGMSRRRVMTRAQREPQQNMAAAAAIAASLLLAQPSFAAFEPTYGPLADLPTPGQVLDKINPSKNKFDEAVSGARDTVKSVAKDATGAVSDNSAGNTVEQAVKRFDRSGPAVGPLSDLPTPGQVLDKINPSKNKFDEAVSGARDTVKSAAKDATGAVSGSSVGNTVEQTVKRFDRSGPAVGPLSDLPSPGKLIDDITNANQAKGLEKAKNNIASGVDAVRNGGTEDDKGLKRFDRSGPAVGPLSELNLTDALRQPSGAGAKAANQTADATREVRDGIKATADNALNNGTNAIVEKTRDISRTFTDRAKNGPVQPGADISDLPSLGGLVDKVQDKAGDAADAAQSALGDVKSAANNLNSIQAPTLSGSGTASRVAEGTANDLSNTVDKIARSGKAGIDSTPNLLNLGDEARQNQQSSNGISAARAGNNLGETSDLAGLGDKLKGKANEAKGAAQSALGDVKGSASSAARDTKGVAKDLSRKADAKVGAAKNSLGETSDLAGLGDKLKGKANEAKGAAQSALGDVKGSASSAARDTKGAAKDLSRKADAKVGAAKNSLGDTANLFGFGDKLKGKANEAKGAAQSALGDVKGSASSAARDVKSAVKDAGRSANSKLAGGISSGDISGIKDAAAGAVPDVSGLKAGAKPALNRAAKDLRNFAESNPSAKLPEALGQADKKAPNVN